MIDPSLTPATDPAKRKSGGPKEKEKEKKDPLDDPNKGEDEHPFRLGAFCLLRAFVRFFTPRLWEIRKGSSHVAPWTT